jgi:hypothetical protein
MIIYPNLKLTHDKSDTLSRRDIVITADGFAGVFFGGHLHYVKPNGELILSAFPPTQTKFTSVQNSKGDILFFEAPNITVFEKIVLPNNQDLYELSSMGIDAAVICLRIKSRSSDTADEIYQRSLRLRPRYQNYKALTFSEATEYYMRLKIIDPIIAQLKVSYFAHPFGSGHFHSNIEKSAPFTVSDYFQKHYQPLGIPRTLSTQNAQKYIIQNIFFQNSIKQEHADLFMEKDRLNFVNLNFNSPQFTTPSRELEALCRSMTKETKNRFRKMAGEAIYRICSERHLNKHFTASALTQHASNLSIFCASQFCRDAKDRHRIKSFFNAGARKLGHLTNLPN